MELVICQIVGGAGGQRGLEGVLTSSPSRKGICSSWAKCAATVLFPHPAGPVTIHMCRVARGEDSMSFAGLGFASRKGTVREDTWLARGFGRSSRLIILPDARVEEPGSGLVQKTKCKRLDAFVSGVWIGKKRKDGETRWSEYRVSMPERRKNGV